MFKLERKVDIVAFAALFIGLISAGWQLKEFIVGARVKCIAPKQILIFAANRGITTNLQVDANLTYINSGAKGYPEAILREMVRFEIADKTYELQWQKTVHSHRGAIDPTKLEIDEKDDAAPFAIDGGDVVTHETNFQPELVDRPGVARRINFLEYDTFLHDIENIDEISFQISYETAKGKVATTSCLVKLDQQIKKELKERHWSAPTCAILERPSFTKKTNQF